MNPYLISSEYSSSLPVLIIDKQGILGLPLAQKLSLEFLTIFVHGTEAYSGNNVIHTPYKKRLSVIPENLFSYIFIISESESELLSQVKTLRNKAVESEAQIVVVLPATLSRERLLRKLQRLTPDSTIVVHGDCIGTGQNASVVDTYLAEVVLRGQIQMSKSGRETSYPVYIDDIIAGIIRATFSEKHTGEVFLVLPEYPVSDISAVRMIQKELPETTVHRVSHTRRQLPYFIPRKAIHVFSEYDAEKGIKAALHHFPDTGKLHSSPTYIPTRLAVMQQRVRTILFILSVSVVSLVVLLVFGYFGLKGVKTFAPRAAISHSPLLLTSAQTMYLLTKQGVSDVSPLLSLIGLGNMSDALEDRLQAKYDIVQLARGEQSAQTMLHNWSSTVSSPEKLQQLPVILKQQYIAYQFLKGTKQLPASLPGDKYQELTQFLPFIDLLPEMLGSRGPKTYLLVFMNNMELRSGGGSIGTYGLLTMDKGVISDFTVHDVKELDGSMKEASPPPAYLQTHLGTSTLLLRDSAYQPNMPDAMQQVNLQYYLESKMHVDGIISVDMTFLSSLLDLTGPVTLAQYHQVLTKDSFFAQVQAQLNPHTALPKQEYLLALQKEIMQKLRVIARSNPAQLLALIGRQGGERHITVYSEEPSTENLVLASNLSSSNSERRRVTQNTFADFVSVNEANVGGNSENYYLKRSIQQKISLTDGGDEENMISIDYTNTSRTDSQFGGEYKAYVQVVLPATAKIGDITLDGEVQRQTAAVTKSLTSRKAVKQLPTLSVDKTVSGQRVVYGFLITVPVGGVKNVTVSYTIPQVVKFVDGRFVYRYMFAKQPGTLSDPLHVVVDFPQTYTLPQYSNGTELQDRQILFDGSLQTDQSFTLAFTAP